MSRSLFGTRLQQALGGLTLGGRLQQSRPRTRLSPAVESLEHRALLANITASAVVSSTPVGASFDYTIQLTNSSSSSSAIGTFWYAWVPGQDYLATRPASVTAPTGWTDLITHTPGANDGYAIQFTTNNPADYVPAGSSLSFGFVSADKPASVNGTSVFYPGTPVGTFTVYPTTPFSDSGHEFVAAPAPTPTPTPTPTSTPLVTVTNVQDLVKKNHLVQITVDFSGPVNAAEAQNTGIYRLATPGKHGSFTARNAGIIKLRSAVYNAANDSVTLTPRKPFALTKPIQLVVDGLPPSGLQDSEGRLIDGGHTGQPGSNAVAVLRGRGVTLSAVALARVDGAPAAQATAAAVLMDQQVVIGAVHPAGAEHLKLKAN